MSAADVITALVGLVGALIGAGAGYLGAVRSAERSNRPAWTSAALDAARILLSSDDPASRAQGSRLLQAAAAAIGAAADAPDQIRRATRGRHLAGVLEQVSARGEAGAPPTFAPADGVRRSAVADGGAGDPVILVSARDVDAATAEVDAFRAAGLSPDPVVVRLAQTGTGPDDGTDGDEVRGSR